MTHPAPDPAEQYIRTPEILAMIKRVLRYLLLLSGAVAVVSAGIGIALAGAAGLWAALLATALGLFFTLTTIGALWLVAGRGQQLLMIALLGGWLMKMMVLIGVLIWLREETFYHRGVFVATLMFLVVAALVIEMLVVSRTRLPYVGVNSHTSVADAPRPSAETAPTEPQDGGDSPRPSAD